MRPDLEDYEDLNTNEDEAPRSRAMSWLVLAVAVGGFAALAYYAYHSGTSPSSENDMMVVQADETPIKQAPADAEGEQFANKDKTIYDVISPANNGDAGNVENLLPEPEKPVLDARNAQPYAEETVSPAPAAGATTYVNKEAAKPATTVDPVDAQSMKQPAPVASPAPMVSPAPQAQAAAIEPKPAAAPAPIMTEPAGAPKFVNEVPVATTTKKVTTTEPAKKPTAEPKKETVKKPAATPASGGAYQIQLGAYKSEDEARASWKKISAKFASVLTGSPSVVKADLPNGTFYRLRTGGFSSGDAAKAACAKLTSQKQACIPVGK